MMETAVVNFKIVNTNKKAELVELEVPLNITANDLINVLNEVYELGMSNENAYGNYLVMENPIAFLRGNKLLKEYGMRNGTKIIYKRK